MATSLFASLNGRWQNNSWKISVEVGEFPDWLKNDIVTTFLSSALPRYTLEIMDYILQNLYGNNFHDLDLSRKNAKIKSP